MAFVVLASLLMGATGALAQDFSGTVNQVTPGQQSRDKAAVVRAGYQPSVFQFAQAGNLFFTVTKGGDIYGATVTPRGKVYVSNGIAAASSPASGM